MSLHLRWAAAIGLCLIAALIVVLVLLVLGQSDRSPRTPTSAPAPQQSDQPQGLTDDVAPQPVSLPRDDADDHTAGHEAVRSADSDTTEPIEQDTGSAETTYAEQQPETDENSSAADVTTPEAQSARDKRGRGRAAGRADGDRRNDHADAPAGVQPRSRSPTRSPWQTQ